MGSPEIERDEPVTPAGRLFLLPEMDQIINCVVGAKYPLDVDTVKTEIANSMMLTHPRFRSLMVRDRRGREYWRKTEIDIDRHVIVKHESFDGDDDEDATNGYLAELTVSSPLSADKPLWEIHLLTAHKCAAVRIHHALGDGISLMSLFLASSRCSDSPDKVPTIGSTTPANPRRSRSGRRNLLWELLCLIWYTLVFTVEFALRSLWVKDRITPISGGPGVELWPRKLATAKFLLEDMKAVKNAIPNATINDVLCGVISAGLSRYLDHRSGTKLQEGLQLTGVAMVNLRKQPGLQKMTELMESKSGSQWGNKFGAILLPVHYHKHKAVATSPLHHVKVAKAMIDKKKRSLEAHFSYNTVYFLMSYLGWKLASVLNYRILCNTTFTISNIPGPREEVTVVGNPITYIRITSSGLPHGITMHMVSYAGRADMQILVAREIVPDPKFLAECFEEALLEMKEAADQGGS